MTLPPGPQRASCLASAHNFRPEYQLIVRCARLNLTDLDRAELRALARSNLDWSAVLAETLRQSLVPLVYRHLQAHCPELLPSEILFELRKHYLLASARSMALAAELREATILLEAEGVASLPYKGPVLALQAYGDVSLRTFNDLDLLVHPSDVGKARELLARRGYKPRQDLTPSREAAILKVDHNLPLIREDDQVVIELHWRVAPAAVTFPMPLYLLWDRSSPILLGGTKVRGMSTSDLILVLAVHGTRHGWSAIEWITGIAELMRHDGGVCWAQVMEEAEAFRAARSVRLAIALANRLLEAPVPLQVARWIDKDSRLDDLIDWVASRLFVPIDDESPAGQMALFRFELAVKDGIKERLRDGWYRIFSPTYQDWSNAELPDRIFFMYHFLRPVRLLGRYLRIRRSSEESRSVCSKGPPAL